MTPLCLPRQLFDVLVEYDEREIREVPGIGETLRDLLVQYHNFRRSARQLEEDLTLRIGQSVGVPFPVAWKIFFRYLVMRFGGATKEQIISWGNFLNYSITWDQCEQLFTKFSEDPELAQFEKIFTEHTNCEELTEKLRKPAST